jgi:hypothetical protein
MALAMQRYFAGPFGLAAAASLLVGVPLAAQYGAPSGPTTSVRGAPIGADVVVSMVTGLAPGARVSVGFGGLSGGYELLGRGEVGPDGAVAVTVKVPNWVERNLVYFFFVNAGGGVRLFSDPFLVTWEGGALQVRGAVSEVAGGCVHITGLDDTRYALSGVTTPLAVGTQVIVDGHVGSDAAVEAGAACGGRPAIPIRVARVTAR